MPGRALRGFPASQLVEPGEPPRFGASRAALLNDGRREDDGEPDEEEDECEGREPAGEAQPLGEGLDDLEDDPGGRHVDGQNLPERPAVDLEDEALQAFPGREPAHGGTRGRGGRFEGADIS